MIALKLDFADLDLWPLLDLEHQNDSVARSDALILGRDLRELTAVLSKKLFDNHLGFLNLCGIKLAFHAQTDFALLQAVENVGFRNGMIALVANSPDLRTLPDFKHDNLCV